MLRQVFDRNKRKEQVAASMAAKQKKRADNIAMRKDRKKEKLKGKGGSSKKASSGKARPGFEGKSFGRSKK